MDITPPKTTRDPRVDVLRGAALLMIFADHVPPDLLNHVTLHAYGFCDAAEVFVLLAGYSSMIAYGRAFERDGTGQALRKIAARCAKIYLFQLGLLLFTMAAVELWTRYTGLKPGVIAPMLRAPVQGLAHAVMLQALPSYLDILPLYVLLLAAFPLLYGLLRLHIWLGLGASALLWFVAGQVPALNLPNWMDGKGWYFDPFAWQFLFAIGAVLSLRAAAGGGALPRRRWLVAAAIAYLVLAFFQGAPWNDWNMADHKLFAMASPDKSTLAWPRIVDILALLYLVLSSERALRLCASRWLQPLNACGRHSLEVFSTCCVLALCGRLWFRTHDAGLAGQVLVNVVGIGGMCLVGMVLELRKARGSASLRHAESVHPHDGLRRRTSIT